MIFQFDSLIANAIGGRITGGTIGSYLPRKQKTRRSGSLDSVSHYEFFYVLAATTAKAKLISNVIFVEQVFSRNEDVGGITGPLIHINAIRLPLVAVFKLDELIAEVFAPNHGAALSAQ